MNDFLKDPRFSGIKRFEQKVWLSSPTMHGEEQHWVDKAIQTNWVSTSPVKLILPDGQIREFENGHAATEAVFDQNYRITEVRAVEAVVEIKVETVRFPTSTWVGEEQGFF